MKSSILRREMDGSANSTTAVNTDQPQRKRIICGIVGGTIGLIAVLLIVYCIYHTARRNSCKNKRSHQERSYSIKQEQARNEITQTHTTAKADIAANAQNNSNKRADAKKAPLPPSRVEIQQRSPLQTMRPLPASPRKAPKLPPTLPYTTKSVNHETPYINTYGPQHRPVPHSPSPQNPFE